jgi:hypothetical protein
MLKDYGIRGGGEVLEKYCLNLDSPDYGIFWIKNSSAKSNSSLNPMNPNLDRKVKCKIQKILESDESKFRQKMAEQNLYL